RPLRRKRDCVWGQQGNVQPFSEDDASIETLSHCSSLSERTSAAEEAGETEEMAQEDFQYKLKVYIDSTVDKSAKTRQGALDGLKTAMATKILYEFISERRMTITDSIERSLKKGKGVEQCAAASLACLLCIQLGSGIESEEVFKTLKPVFKTILNDGAANIQARQACATSLGLCTLVAEDDIMVSVAMKALVRSFTFKWMSHSNLLLAMKMPGIWHGIKTPTNHHGNHQHENRSLNQRAKLGHLRTTSLEFDYDGWEPLCEKLNALATDCTKHRAKTDKRKQRSVFRDVLKAVEEGDFQSETIRFGTERMVIDSWVRKRTYDAFREFVGSGMNYHLQANEFIRDVFELGPPMLIDSAALKAMKSSRLERHLYNAAAFKARTKARNKVRDKRVDVGEF
uniref:Interferon-related developmental regulator 1 n=1 Tax=Cyprinus carpio TaxID=7962 RepID=A0A8C1PAT0_CYPCA